MRTIETTLYTFDELSDEAITENIVINGYEFTEDGDTV
jgi:hypothetical protein